METFKFFPIPDPADLFSIEAVLPFFSLGPPLSIWTRNRLPLKSREIGMNVWPFLTGVGTAAAGIDGGGSGGRLDTSKRFHSSDGIIKRSHWSSDR